jgi:hypothetical protein
MRKVKVTPEIAEAFELGINKGVGNSSVVTEPVAGCFLYLHGNLIAKRVKGKTHVTTAGYPTNTTKERLNGLSGVYVHVKKPQWYLNGKEWDGSWREI